LCNLPVACSHVQLCGILDNTSCAASIGVRGAWCHLSRLGCEKRRRQPANNVADTTIPARIGTTGSNTKNSSLLLHTHARTQQNDCETRERVHAVMPRLSISTRQSSPLVTAAVLFSLAAVGADTSGDAALVASRERRLADNGGGKPTVRLYLRKDTLA
jgi:hypothetical protein